MTPPSNKKKSKSKSTAEDETTVGSDTAYESYTNAFCQTRGTPRILELTPRTPAPNDTYSSLDMEPAADNPNTLPVVNDGVRKVTQVTTNEAEHPTIHEYAVESTLTGMETVVTRYIDTPIVHEKVIHVQRTIETERRVPKYEIEYVEKVVDVPKVEYVDKVEEFEQEQVLYKQVPKIETRDQVIYHPKYVPVEQVKRIETTRYVPGEVVTNKVAKVVDVPYDTFKYSDIETPVVVSQRVDPVILVDEDMTYEVAMRRFTPKCIPVDVYVKRPVYVGEICQGKLSRPLRREKVAIRDVDPKSQPPHLKLGDYCISTAEYNSWLLLLNKGLPDTKNLPFRNDGKGDCPFLPRGTVMRGSLSKPPAMGVPTATSVV